VSAHSPRLERTLARGGERGTLSGSWRVAAALAAVGWGGNAFSPLLVVYERDLGIDPSVLAALFVVYAAGLVPGLLVAGRRSDAAGRRPLVVALTAASPVASGLLMLAPAAAWTLVPGRLLAGIASGVVFAAGGAWVQELTEREGAPAGTGSRRIALAMSAGFAVGPLLSAAVAATLPHPLVLAHVPHVLVAVAALAGLRGVAETRATGGPRRSLLPAAARRLPFWREVGSLGPWVFACAMVSFAVLPVALGGVPVLVAGIVTTATLATGVAVQPLARRMSPDAAACAGLSCAAAGLGLGAPTVAVQAPALLVVIAPVLGAGYGFVLVAGLRLTEARADPAERGALLALFYALTYVGFAAPSVLDAIAAAIGAPSALLLAAAVAGAGAVARALTLRPPKPP